MKEESVSGLVGYPRSLVLRWFFSNAGNMKRSIGWIRKHAYHFIPPIIFFIFAFSLINMTQALLDRKLSESYTNFPLILLAAVIVAKVLVVSDNLPFIDFFPNQPLIYNICWKTSVYGLITLLVRLIMNFLPYFLHSDDFKADYILFVTGINWGRFWAIQIWFFALFFVYVGAREIFLSIGSSKIMNLLFRRKDI